MKKILIATLSLAGAAGLLGQALAAEAGQALSPEQACAQLTVQAKELIGNDASFSCSKDSEQALSVDAGSREDLGTVKARLFPEDRFSGYHVLPATKGSSSYAIGGKRAAALQDNGPLNDMLAQPINFDNQGAHDDKPILLAQIGGGSGSGIGGGPRGGSGIGGGPRNGGGIGGGPRNGGGIGGGPRNGGGIGGNPIGGGPRGGNPIDGGPRNGGGDSLPQGRAAPVWRAVPPPQDLYHVKSVTIIRSPWTEFGGYTWDPLSGLYVSGWFALDPFEYGPASWVYPSSNQAQQRTAQNQNYPLNFAFKGELVQTVRDCYWQARVQYTWVQNGREGSHWKEKIPGYDVKCYEHNRVTIPWNAPVKNISVSFNMGPQSLLPWESENVLVNFDGFNAHVQVENASFQYFQQPSFGSNLITMQAGGKNLTFPDGNGVSATLLRDGDAFKVRVNDNWASYYQGETLEIAVRVIHYRPWSWRHPFASNDEVLNLTWDNGTQARWSPVTLPGVQAGFFDISVPASDSGDYKIDSWAFRRVNNQVPNNQSRWSLGNPISKGAGEWVKK